MRERERGLRRRKGDVDMGHVLMVPGANSFMRSGWELQRYYESTGDDNGVICGTYRDPTKLGCELLLFLRFLRSVGEPKG